MSMPIDDMLIPLAANFLDCMGAMCSGVTLPTSMDPPGTSTGSPTRAARDGTSALLSDESSPQPPAASTARVRTASKNPAVFVFMRRAPVRAEDIEDATASTYLSLRRVYAMGFSDPDCAAWRRLIHDQKRGSFFDQFWPAINGGTL